jgi:hypothetical protein
MEARVGGVREGRREGAEGVAFKEASHLFSTH